MDDRDLAVRNWIYRSFVEMARPAGVADIAAETRWSPAEAEACLCRLHDEHALVLEPERPAILMLNPFSCVPTPHRVEAAGRWWYANCGWDAFGILAALDVDGRISSSCPDCADPIEIDVRDRRPSHDEHVFHVLLPAERWWDDIVFN